MFGSGPRSLDCATAWCLLATTRRQDGHLRPRVLRPRRSEVRLLLTACSAPRTHTQAGQAEHVHVLVAARQHSLQRFLRACVQVRAVLAARGGLGRAGHSCACCRARLARCTCTHWIDCCLYVQFAEMLDGLDSEPNCKTSARARRSGMSRLLRKRATERDRLKVTAACMCNLQRCWRVGPGA